MLKNAIGNKMVYMIDLEGANQQAFKQWWARHPLKRVMIDGKGPYLHMNALLVYSEITVAIGMLILFGGCDLIKAMDYEYKRERLTTEQIHKEYSDSQIARYDFFCNFKEKMNKH